MLSSVREKLQKKFGLPVEQQLELGERRFRALIQASAQIVWVTDAGGQCIEDSPSWRAFTGMTYEQFHGSGWLDALHPEDRDRASEVWNRAVRTRVRYDITYRLRHYTGEWRHTRVRGIPMLAMNGEVQCWVGLNDDITAQVHAEAALAQSELQFRTLASSVPNFIWIADANAQVYYWNETWYDYTGRSPEESYGIRAAEAIADDQREAALVSWLDAVQQGLPMEIEIPLRRRDGVYRWFTARACPMRDDRGRIIKWCGVIFDIDDRRRALDALRQERAERERFVCALVHDLKNSFATNRSVTEHLLGDGLSVTEREQFLKLWQKSVGSAERMIEDLLDANQLEAGGAFALKATAWIDINTLIGDCVDAVRGGSGGDFRILAPLGLRARWSAADITRVFHNLLSNAVKYGLPGGQITIEATLSSNQITLSVHNYGNPISEEDQKLVFGFLKRATTGGQRGWGIGLTLVRGIVEAHGGTVSLSSSAKAGTTFKIDLPIEVEAT